MTVKLSKPSTRGNSLSLTPSGRFPIESIQITGDAGPSASGELRMSDGSELPITATLMSEGALLVTLPADAHGIDPVQVSMIALSLVNKSLDVRPDHITSIVIRGK